MLKILLSFFVLSVSTEVFAGHATISKIRGNVTISKESTKIFAPARLKQRVYAKDTITTGAGSIAQVRFDTGSLMTIGPNSVVVIKKVEAGKTKYISLVNGYLRAKFSKKTSNDHKLMIQTRSAALGIRGTEFNLIYNRHNNVTTALSLEGNVEFSSIEDEGRPANDRVSIKEGEFSTTFAGEEVVSSPTKISIIQLKALKKNTALKSRSGRPVAKIPHNSDAEEVQDKDQQLPKELMGEEHGHTQENYNNDRDTPRPGGYIDLDTGLYIDPPDGAVYNEDDGVFEVPKELGGIDPETGEYIPPLGLILHPLKGFVLASTIIESGVHYVTDKAVIAGSKVVHGATIVAEGLKSAGMALESKTGVVGRQTGKGLRYLGRTAINVGNKTSELVRNKGLGTLNTVAENLNNYLYHGTLKHIGGVLKKIPLISALDLSFSDKFSYSTKQQDKVYGQVKNIVNAPSFLNQLNFSSRYQKTFWKKVFIRPKFQIMKLNYLRTQLPEVKSLNKYRYTMGLDMGAMGKIKGVMVQSYFYSNFSYSSKVKNDNRYGRHLRDREFGFSKLIIGSEYISSKFDYSYGQYSLHNSYHGTFHRLAISEIINLDNKNYFNLGFNWSTRKRNEVAKSISIYGGRFEYFISHRPHRFKFNTWVDYKIVNDQLYRSTRGLEQRLDLGMKLTKSFPKLFSTSLEYAIDSMFSDRKSIDGTSHRLSGSLHISY
ncbi:MAG: FecR domain-containing protein [Bacteriovoracaceae bacterium]|nr:FecR domain-containing protein [Bacteriovoracaceae bacterium]